MTKNSLNLDKIIYFSPLIILVLSLIVKVNLYINFGTEYWLDEIITTVLSRQELGLLLDTIKAEPHPPGFYLFLKLLYTNNQLMTRLILVFLSYLLTFLALFWGYRNKVISTYQLSSGLALFISSYTFLELSAHIKQEILSFPILLLFLLMILKFVKAKGKGKVLDFIFLNMALLLILSLGYIYYFFSILILTLVKFKFRKNSIFSILLLAQSCVFVFYFYLFGWEQFRQNITRFSWFSENYNSFWRALSIHLAGYAFTGFFSDLMVIIFLALFILSWKFRKKLTKNANSLYTPMLGIFSFLILISYPARFFVRTRYSSLPFLILSIFAGWGLLHLPKKKMILPLIFVFFCLAMLSFNSRNVGIYRGQIAKILQEESKKDKFGFLTDDSLSSLAITLNYRSILENVIPLNIYYPRIFENAQTIENKHLSIEGKSLDFEISKIESNLKETGIKNFFYWLKVPEKPNYFDPYRKTLTLLEGSCSKIKIIKLSYPELLFIFRDCFFK